MAAASRVVEMNTQDRWVDPDELTAYLARQLNHSAICLVLGAGVSTAFNLPSWDQLLDRLYTGNEAHRNSSLDVKRQAEDFKNMVCKGDMNVFLTRVTAALYGGYNTELEHLRTNALLGSISTLVMSSVRGRASSVVTFNFDDILEKFLEYHGFSVAAVSDASQWTREADVEILHPHGLLPAPDSIERVASSSIVLDQKQYSRIVGDNANPWRQRLLSAMRSRTCLFLGTSGLDDHMDSLITAAHESHAAKSTSTLYWGVWVSKKIAEAERMRWAERGVYALQVDDWNELPKLLYRIAQQAVVERRR